MALDMKDLAAFAAAERQIQMLPTAEGHTLVEPVAPLPTEPPVVVTDERPSDMPGHEGHNHGPCDEPAFVVTQQCDGSESILCQRHGRMLLTLMLNEGMKKALGVTDGYALCNDCGDPAIECWIPRALTEGERASL